MTHAITFDTFQYAKDLQKAGFTEIQIETQVKYAKEQMKSINDVIDGSLATKQDIKELELKIEESKNELKRDIKELELRMTIKLGSLLIVGISLLVVFMKLFHL